MLYQKQTSSNTSICSRLTETNLKMADMIVKQQLCIVDAFNSAHKNERHLQMSKQNCKLSRWRAEIALIVEIRIVYTELDWRP